MLILITLFLIQLRLIWDNELVQIGAKRGLMLWYEQLLPILLPFLLISSLFTLQVTHYTTKNNKTKSQSFCIGTTLLLGILCGCPIGAKTTASFYRNGQITKRNALLFLPLCNNISPMFLAGYITTTILKKSIHFLTAFSLIYLPYLIYLILAFCITSIVPIHTPAASVIKYNSKSNASDDLILNSILQITYIGFYVMICSIVIEFVITYAPFRAFINYIISCLTEITIGTSLLHSCTDICLKTKTAYILAFTSFGGLSALLQTYKMLQQTKLSIVYYILIKIICAISTFFLTILLI